eukprot:9234-Chlamydomonas_euryale.AAC.1
MLCAGSAGGSAASMTARQRGRATCPRLRCASTAFRQTSLCARTPAGRMHAAPAAARASLTPTAVLSHAR